MKQNPSRYGLVIGLVLALTGAGVENLAATTMTALKAVDTLAVKGRAPKTGYARIEFGRAWLDVDHNGCDTRNDILRRDMVGITFKAGSATCLVAFGKLVDPYSGATMNFVRGVKTSALVQIDHVVALSNAWQTGAFKLSAGKRIAMANDPLNLLAVNGSLNEQKSDGDAATWLPPLKSYRCSYVARQVAVKKKYGLWVTPAEKVAIVKILTTCPKQTLPV